jgi:hypothetical protein
VIWDVRRAFPAINPFSFSSVSLMGIVLGSGKGELQWRGLLLGCVEQRGLPGTIC